MSMENNNNLNEDPRIAFFDRHAENWRDSQPPVEAIIARFEQVKELLALKPGHNVLELGCGPGQYTKWIYDQVKPGRVTSTDFSPAMIAEASRQMLPVDFMISDICTEPPELSMYHNVFCYNAFPHFRDKKSALRNIRRSLRRGGVLVVLHFMNRHQLSEFHAQVGGPVQNDVIPSDEEWEALITEANLTLQVLKDEEDLFLLRAVRE